MVTGASFARGQSKQSYATPRDFLDAVKIKFGVKVWAWDLAATAFNTVTVEPHHHFGPDRAPEYRDALVQNWTKLRGDLFCNPPYADIAPWAAKCAMSVRRPLNYGLQIFFLVPAAVGSNWWADHVHNRALVVFPRPRLSFDGKNSYPKDVALCIYGARANYETWRWRP